VELEICCNGLESALVAQKSGADRIELCSELRLGGLTPAKEVLLAVRKLIHIPIYVLIRPRAGDFVYSTKEFDAMISDIDFCVQNGFDGIVSGVLLENFNVDIKRTELLFSAAKKLDFTFHRAFDEVADTKQALTDLELIGVKRILSSGQEKTALQGLSLLQSLEASTDSIHFMPGAGINRDNILYFKTAGFKAAHASASKVIGVDESGSVKTVSDLDEIQAMLKIIRA